MLNLPASAAFERRIPKQKFYANLTVTPELRRCFTEQIESITWADKLAPQTMNLAAGQRVQEIEVFRIRLAGDALDGKVTELMDKQIPYHILFVLTRPDGMLRLLMNYKEAAPGGGFTLRQRCARHRLPAPAGGGYGRPVRGLCAVYRRGQPAKRRRGGSGTKRAAHRDAEQIAAADQPADGEDAA